MLRNLSHASEEEGRELVVGGDIVYGSLSRNFDSADGTV
jgi:hypothetical protein